MNIIGFKMLSYSVISFVILWASLSSGSFLTSELLECRANLTTAIKNDTTFLEKVRQSDYIFTGKVKELQHGQLLHVRVKRAIKGALNVTVDLVVNDTCGRYIRRSYTGIFMARRGANDVGRIVMHFGPVPLTLANLDRLNAAVRGKLAVRHTVSFFAFTERERGGNVRALTRHFNVALKCFPLIG
ncbi:PREDICTED: uncharacterized protein LOC108765548 [Trachymyrmex cornetzi]|uniref:uncharacterized protein LOC108765548 n=1 Tax=Trachymyrmex cornetzi TaxID=471704 RepID=UPI00084F1292|nr:PREDICTED: uncharacterized protein LOC108765548 [Trachymyrmex cornetzi]